MAYFLPINSTSLAHYFVCACVKPAKYIHNKLQDVQDLFPNSLLLSTKLGNKIVDCCLELVLTEEEEKYLQPCGNDYRLFPMPLPISRVKKIYFRDRKQLNQTLSNINMSAAFVPDSLAEVSARFSTARFNTDRMPSDITGNDYSHKVELFDRILGALALMKTAKEPYMNYSENYASTLSFFNTRIKEELHAQGYQINDKFFDLFTRAGKFIKAVPYLERRITRDDVDAIAEESKQTVERSFTGLINFEKLSGMTYAFAILQTYGVAGEAASKKIDSLIANNFQDLKKGTEEGIALYYGYNRGYSVFSNSYGTGEVGRQVVKFLLDSKLDYYTIESVYQYVFYSNNSASVYPYIDTWCPVKVEKPTKRSDYKILDTVITGKKKPSVFSKEYLFGFLGEIRKLDVFNTNLLTLIDSVRNRVASDAKEEFDDAAQIRISEVESKWSAKFNEQRERIGSLISELEQQRKINAELQEKNCALIGEIEALKSILCCQQIIGDADKQTLGAVEPEGELADVSEIDDLPEENVATDVEIKSTEPEPSDIGEDGTLSLFSDVE